jgi:predicted Fe-Mo cluster-binding NifX family protein
MKIVFTTKGNTWDSPMDARFGRADMFVLYDETTDTLETISNSDSVNKEHGVGLQSAKKVLQMEADLIITGNGAGEKALDIFKSSSVKIYVGAGDMTLKEAYEAYKANKLKTQF